MQAKFTQGSILRHINVMTLSGTAGLIALFLVDLVDSFFLSLLGEVSILAALGYAGSILFFTLSMSIGLSIGCGAVVARLAGKGDKQQTRRFICHVFLVIVAITLATSTAILMNLTDLLQLLGASDEALHYADQYSSIVLPSMPLMAIAMAAGGVIRALGEAKAAMVLPLVAAGVNAILDPIFIFTFGWGIEGAAWASVIARVAMLGFGLWVVIVHHQLLGRWQLTHFGSDVKQFFSIALPAALTNLSTPIAVACITAIMAQYGDEAVGGNAIIARIQQVAFAGLFALSGAIGGIAAQNWGANQVDRVRQTLTKSLQFVAVYCLVVCTALAIATPWLITLFGATGVTANLIRWFCLGFSIMFLFNGATFVTNALFNNLGVARYATLFNFGKATLGTIPFAYFGAQWAGPWGIFAGVTLGAAIFAACGVWMCYSRINHLPQQKH